MKANLLTFIQNRLGKLGWNTLLVFIIFRCGDVANLICKLTLGRILPETDFGALDPIYALLAVFSIPLIALFQTCVKSISRLDAYGHTAERQSLTRDMLKIAGIGSLIFFVATAALRPLILSRLHLDGNIYILLIALMVSLEWFAPMYHAIIQGTHNYRLLNAPIVIKPFVLLGLTLILVIGFHGGLKGSLSARIIAEAMTLCFMLTQLRSAFKKTATRYPAELRHIKKTMLPMLGYVASWTILFHFDRLYVRNFLLEDSGGYGAITTLSSIPSFIIGSVVFVVFPLAAAEHAQGRDLNRFYRQALWIGLGITLLSVLFFALTARPLMAFWNPAFEPYAPYAWVYTLAMGLFGIIQIIASVEIARHQYRFLWFISVPTVAMCGLLYFTAGTATIPRVIGIVLVTRIVILVGIWLNGRLQPRAIKPAS
jgi:O-antigen/teichoic acid export membrane protein